MYALVQDCSPMHPNLIKPTTYKPTRYSTHEKNEMKYQHLILNEHCLEKLKLFIKKITLKLYYGLREILHTTSIR